MHALYTVIEPSALYDLRDVPGTSREATCLSEVDSIYLTQSVDGSYYVVVGNLPLLLKEGTSQLVASMLIKNADFFDLTRIQDVEGQRSRLQKAYEQLQQELEQGL